MSILILNLWTLWSRYRYIIMIAESGCSASPLKEAGPQEQIRDPGWKKFESRTWDKHPGSATQITTVR
jgi:hypothetical protein